MSSYEHYGDIAGLVMPKVDGARDLASFYDSTLSRHSNPDENLILHIFKQVRPTVKIIYLAVKSFSITHLGSVVHKMTHISH